MKEYVQGKIGVIHYVHYQGAMMRRICWRGRVVASWSETCLSGCLSPCDAQAVPLPSCRPPNIPRESPYLGGVGRGYDIIDICNRRIWHLLNTSVRRVFARAEVLDLFPNQMNNLPSDVPSDAPMRRNPTFEKFRHWSWSLHSHCPKVDWHPSRLCFALLTKPYRSWRTAFITTKATTPTPLCILPPRNQPSNDWKFSKSSASVPHASVRTIVSRLLTATNRDETLSYHIIKPFGTIHQVSNTLGLILCIDTVLLNTTYPKISECACDYLGFTNQCTGPMADTSRQAPGR